MRCEICHKQIEKDENNNGLCDDCSERVAESEDIKVSLED